jgi:putative transposase
LGVNNLCAVAINKVDGFLINGRPLKSINQFYNKRKAKLQSLLPNKQKWSKQLSKLTNKRNNKINDYLHKTSKYLINYLVSNKINTLIVGKNKNWKQKMTCKISL